ncbi:MAG: PAS domain S-box protein [Candidatus Eisenbacteria sp.]|nr:PAS domain S-box protein [Candidatus Eisenbacteria bacterium]
MAIRGRKKPAADEAWSNLTQGFGRTKTGKGACAFVARNLASALSLLSLTIYTSDPQGKSLRLAAAEPARQKPDDSVRELAERAVSSRRAVGDVIEVHRTKRKIVQRYAHAFPLTGLGESSGALVAVLASTRRPGRGVLQKLQISASLLAERLVCLAALRGCETCEARYRDLFENIHIPVAAFRMPSGELLTWNPKFAELTGYSDEEMAVKTMMDFICPDDAPKLAKRFLDRRAGKDVPDVYEISGIHASGEKRDIELYAQLYYEQGEVVGTLVAMLDVTDRKRAEQELRESNEIIGMSPAIAFLWRNADGWPVEYVSDNVEELFGYSADELMSGKVPYARTIHPDDLEKVATEVLRYSKEEGRSEFSQMYRIVTKDGAVRWIDDRTCIRRDENGEITHYQGIVLDITGRKRMEEALRESEEKFRKMGSSAWDALVMMDDDGRISFWNEAAEKMFGYCESEALGKELHPFLAPERYLKRYKEGFAGFRTTGEGRAVGLTLDLVGVRKDGTEVPIELSLSSVKLAGKWNAIGIMRDVTERKRAEKALRDVNTALRAADEMKDEFLSMVSHELKAPLTSIKGSADLMLLGKEGELTPGQARFLNLISTSTTRADRLIQDLLDLSRVESGFRERPPQDVNLQQLAYEAIDPMKHLALEKDIALDVENMTALPAVRAGMDQIRQVMTNLISNALRFTAQGGRVWIDGRVEGNEVIVSVDDTGIGITPENHERIFEKFHQLGPGKVREGGTGLGLTICKRIVENHGGRIWVESKPGDGSRFCFSLPIRTGEKS